MNPRFKQCLEQKKIFRSRSAPRLAPRELDAARNDLDAAANSVKLGNYKWATIQGYYAMFHSARALLFRAGFRERSHICVELALEALFVENGKFPPRLLRAFSRARELREEADYELEFSKESAEAVVKHAREFVEATAGLYRA